MNPSRIVPVVGLLWAAACVTDSTYKQEVKKADALSSQNATYEKLNTQLEAEVKANHSAPETPSPSRPTTPRRGEPRTAGSRS
jgi:hypothetical protein